jgi:DNA polymerase-1
MNLFEYVHSEEENVAAAASKARHSAEIQRLRSDIAEASNRRTYQAMLDSVADWRPPELPQLDAFDEVFIDLETTGLRWWDSDRLIGAGLWTPDGVARYLPIRHKMGPNIPEENFFEWCRRELRGKRIVNIRTKFDLHLFRQDGIDLERQGCTFGDVAHYAGLLDDHRRLFNQEDLALAFLAANGVLSPEECKVKAAHGYALDPSKFAEYPAGLVAPRAEGDVRIVSMLQKVMWPLLTEQDLHEVRKIEDAIIPVVVEMEHNGAFLDVETLNRWVKESERDLNNLRHAIRRGTGIEFEKFTSRQNAMRLFRSQHIEIPLDPEEPHNRETGEPNYSFADALLKHIPNRWIRAYRAGLQLESLRSKFLIKYQASTARDGILRYELHQMPYQDDSKGHGGAVSGRFSSAAPNQQEGANIQQVFGVDSQKRGRPFTQKYIVKKLFIPADKRAQYANADASQLQFRIFGHYADDPKIIEAYQRDYQWEEIDRRAAKKHARGEKLTKDDKLTDFHEAVGDLVLKFTGVELTRTHTKNINFAQVFGAGIRKMAAQLGVPADQIPGMLEPLESGGPEFQKAVSISNTYHSMFPSVKPLLALTSHLAMPEHKTGRDGNRKCGEQCRRFYREGYSHRGWVRTFKGRRARFGPHDRHYSALNRIIQGTEADLIKKIMIEVHAERERLGFLERFTVHDALVGDLQGDPMELKRTLNHQYYDFKVPILWEVGVGKNWAEAK